MHDTSPEAAAVVRAAVLSRPPAERLRQALQLSEQIRELSLTALRKKYPERSTLELIELMLGIQLVPPSHR
jgi:hypothetical protein